MTILTRRVFAFSRVSSPLHSIHKSYAVCYRRICSYTKNENTYITRIVVLSDMCRRTVHAS